MTPLQMVDFNTERFYDVLTINNMQFSGQVLLSSVQHSKGSKYLKLEASGSKDYVLNGLGIRHLKEEVFGPSVKGITPEASS